MDTPPTGPATNGRLPPRSACGKHPSRLLQYGPVYSALCNKSAGIKLQTEYTRHTIKGCPHKQPKPREPYILQLHDYPQASLYDQGYEQSLPKVPDDIRDIGRIIAGCSSPNRKGVRGRRQPHHHNHPQLRFPTSIHCKSLTYTHTTGSRRLYYTRSRHNWLRMKGKTTLVGAAVLLQTMRCNGGRARTHRASNWTHYGGNYPIQTRQPRA